MSFLEGLESLSPKSSRPAKCRISAIISSSTLDPEEQEKLRAVIEENKESSRYVPTTRLVGFLQSQGHDLSSPTMDRHRRHECACYRPTQGATE